MKRIYKRELDAIDVDLAPRATIKRPIDALRTEWAIVFDREQDDLDAYSIAYYWLSPRGRIPVTAALLHYDAGPNDTINILLPRDLKPAEVPAYVRCFIKGLGLSSSVIEWCEGLPERHSAVGA